MNENVSPLLGLAGFKAILVSAFIQHLKDEARTLSIVMLVGLVFVLALTSISFFQLKPFRTSIRDNIQNSTVLTV